MIYMSASSKKKLRKEQTAALLTEKQQSAIDQYYNQDLSLAEIAENEGITRQGVRDAVKRAEAQLELAKQDLTEKTQNSLLQIKK